MTSPLLFILAVVSQALPTPGAAPPAGAISASQAAAMTGRRVVVCGNVTGTRSPASREEPTVIRVGQPALDTLAMIVRTADRGKFSAEFESLLVGREVCIEGQVERVDGTLQMGITDPGQVKFVGQPARSALFAVGIPMADGRTTSHAIPLKRPNPRYTDAAMRARISGEVEVDAVIGEDGRVRDLQLRKSLDPLYGLDEEAIATARQWEFTPAIRDGQPVATRVVIVLTFRVR